MDLLPSEEQDAIASAAADVLADLGYPERANELAARGESADDKLWMLVVDLGWLSLGLSEDAGGAGYGLPEQVMVARELGRALAVGPVMAGMVAASVATDELRSEVVAGRPVGWELGPDGDDLLVLGTGDLMLRSTEDGLAFRRLEQTAEPVGGIDPTAPLGRVPQSTGGLVATGDAHVAEAASVLISAALAGIAEAVRDQAVAHAKSREQFGRPIGSFQAIKHTCADMAVRAEAAWRQVCWAALAVHDRHDDAATQARAARIVAQDAALIGAADNIQVHGAMGFTAEHTAHLYLKRARTWATLMPVRGVDLL